MKRLILFLILVCSFVVSKAQYLYLLSPDGGETFAIGSSQSITWASLGINEIDIEYSSNNGTSFSLIASNVSAFSNNFDWQISGPATSNGVIRIKESLTGNFVDVSTLPFNVVAPSIQITYPSISSVFNPGQVVNITWTGFFVGNNVSILFSSNNGTTYDTIISNTTNFYNYDWTVPSVASTNCKIKLIDAAVPTVFNISPTFTIEALPSSGTVLTPNGGETLLSTTSYDITWTANGTNIIDLEYSSNGGSSWNIIAQSVLSNLGTYSWTVPSVNSSNAKVRLINSINGLVLDESNSTFTISQPVQSLYLSSPFGYEHWAVGSTQIIQWTYSYITDIKIEYSTNGGSSYNIIAASTPASALSYSWTIPSNLSTNCFIRITDNNSATTSQNQNPFSIVSPSISLLSPNGGEVFNSNVDTLITWNGNLISNLVKIEYSTNGGTLWNLIANNVINTNYYHWLVPNTPSTNCKIRISDAQFPSLVDISNNAFTITAPTPFITLLSPNGAEQWAIGTNQTIFWSSTNIVNVKIEYTTNNGNSWNVISNTQPASDNSFTWLVNSIPSNNAKIRVSDAANTAVFDTSNASFEIYTPTAILDLLYPNGGEQFFSGINSTITWNAQAVGVVSLEYSVNNGVSWQLIESGILASIGSYVWSVPVLLSNNVKIRIRDEANAILNDQSASFFSINQPSINFDSFPNGLTFTLFTNFNILWSSYGLTNQLLRLEYSLNNGATWVTFASGVPNTGSYNWLINCAPSASVTFKISVDNNPSINDISPGNITVIANGPAIIILNPNTQQIISSGSIFPINWNSYGINYVRIEYNLNGSPNYQLITPFTPASTGLFNWNVPPNINATNCNIRISNAANTSLFAQTPVSFSIQTGSMFMVSGNSSDILLAGQNYFIDWISNATSNYVNIDYTVDSLNWISIASNYQNTGSLNWNVPYLNADTVWLRVQDQFNLNTQDVNNAPQQILIADSTIELLNPSDGTVLLAGSNTAINWNSNGINTIDIEYSDNNGISWNTVVSNVIANIGTYLWDVPNLNTNNAIIRISNSNYPLQFSQNQTPFSISDANLTIVSPNGGEVWNAISSYYITWQSVGVDFVNLYYSSDAGVNYNVIDTNIYNIGYYNWQTPLTGGSNFKIKIEASNDQLISDESNAIFTIANTAPAISLNAPNGGEQLQANSGTYITWQTTGISDIDISYSLNGGSTFIPIANNVSTNPAYYYWLVPDTQIVNAKIKISSSINNNLNDVSNSNFAIINDSTQLQLSFPNGGETFNSFSFQTIKWSALNTPFVKLYYSTNGGFSYNYINAVFNDSMYIWQVPAIASITCKIKIENGNDASQFDVSNINFAINNQPLSSAVIAIDSLTNNIFCTGASIPISFTTTSAFNSNNNFRVHLSSQNGSFNNFTDIGGLSSNISGTIQCLIPLQLLAGTSYSLRIVADNPATISPAYSFGNITINSANAEFTSDQQLVLFPNTTVQFQPNNPLNSTLNSAWNTGNGGNYSSYNASHTYNAAGKYDISHTVTDTNGCSTVLIKSRLISVEHWFPNYEVNINQSLDLIDIDFEDPRYGCAIFKNGNCLVTSDSGKTWSISYTNYINTNFNSVTTLNNAWYITTDNGAYLKSTNRGNNWTPFTFNNNESLKDLIFISSSLAYAVGNNGKLIRFNGTNWQNQNAGTTSVLKKIANKNNTTLVVGNNATILKEQNNIWSAIVAPVNVNLNGIVLKDSLNGFIVGDFGFILKTIDAGATWTVVLSGADVNFSSVMCAGDSVWAIGNEGTVYTSTDNGNQWNRFNIGVSENLNSITYINHKGFIVGESGLMRTFNKVEFIPVVDQLKEIQNELLMYCFPNPAKDKLNITFKNMLPSDYIIRINDVQGKVILENKLNKNMSNTPYSIDISQLKNGIYFLSVIANDRHQTIKIIKTE